MKTQKQKTAVIIVAVAMAVLTIIIIAGIVSEKKEPKKTVSKFVNCSVLVDSCKDQNCKFLFLCNEAEFSDCRVYDCGKNYGVRITDKAGNIQEKVREKTSPYENEKTKEMIAKCSGTFEVIEKKNCENGKATAKVKLSVKGDCEIKSATMTVNGKTRIASVERDGKFYSVSIKSCGEISDIKMTGEGGVGIGEKVEVKDISPEDIMEERLPIHSEYKPEM
ncbi:MAG: hypothetical protein U9N04_00010 [Patescibacteria group bacterium]|nr:hypothetical protein [Patescibacteria group bacterium]